MRPEDRASAQIIWDYMQLHQPPRHSKVAIAMGVTNLGVAWRCAELWQQNLVDHFIFSGYAPPGMGITEATLLANEAIRCGVSEEAITLEPYVSNSAKNLSYSYKLMQELDLSTDTVTIASRPCMERRTYAITGAQWPDKHTSFYFTSYKESLDEHMLRSGVERTISTMLGNLRRIDEYPAKGWQIPQDIPDSVWSAYKTLAKRWQVRAIQSES